MNCQSLIWNAERFDFTFTITGLIHVFCSVHMHTKLVLFSIFFQDLYNLFIYVAFASSSAFISSCAQYVSVDLSKV